MDFDLEKIYPLLDSINTPILAVNRKCRILLLNDAACQLAGVSKKEVSLQPLPSLTAFAQLSSVCRLKGLPEPQQIRVGDAVYLAVWSLLYGETNSSEQVGIICFLQDITGFLSIADELQHSKEVSRELGAIIDSSFDGIYVTDGDGLTLKINQAYSRITGLAESDVVGKRMEQLVIDGIFDESVTLKVLERKRVVTIVQRISKTDRTIVVTGNPVFDAAGKIIRVVTNVRDVTELNRLQEQLKEMERLQSKYEDELHQLKREAETKRRYVIKSKKMKEVYQLVRKLAKANSTVLVQGESGVGKEIVAELIHLHGVRRENPFVTMSCAAIPENLLESELFGYSSGSFTGASKGGKAGLFELASGGTLFLDEIGEMPIALQVKLLRVLQQKEVVRIGSHQPIKVDTRIIAATNRDLQEMVADGEFRKDLYYRLNVIPIMIPPLRERSEAICHFVSQIQPRSATFLET